MSRFGKEKYVEVKCWIHSWTDKAILISTGDAGSEQWVPRVTLHYSDDTKIDAMDAADIRGQKHTMRIAKWFCTKNGLE